MPVEFIYILLLSVALIALFVAIGMWRRKRKLAKHSDKDFEVNHGAVNNHNCMPKNAIAISAIESLILKDNQGHELALSRPDTTQLAERKYREICVRGSSAVGQVAQGTMPILAHAKTLSEIAKAAPEGLFVATGSVQDLMRYADGTIGSAVIKNGKIAGHAGFTEVALKVANPAAVVGAGMQAMAMISGQYYMHEISEQLKSVDQKLDKLIGYHHDEKIGILKSVNRDLRMLAAKVNVDVADIISCQRIAERCGEVYYEYYTRLEGVSVGVKERWFNKPKELRELGENITESELDFSIQMCYRASELHEKCKITEIAVRMKIGDAQERFIAEQIESLINIGSEAFHNNIHQYIDTHYAPVLEKAEKIAEAKKIPLLFGNASQEAIRIQRRKESTLDKIKEDENAGNLAYSLVRSLCEPQETLILLGETPETQRVFVLDEGQ